MCRQGILFSHFFLPPSLHRFQIHHHFESLVHPMSFGRTQVKDAWYGADDIVLVFKIIPDAEETTSPQLECTEGEVEGASPASASASPQQA